VRVREDRDPLLGVVGEKTVQEVEAFRGELREDEPRVVVLVLLLEGGQADPLFTSAAQKRERAVGPHLWPDAVSWCTEKREDVIDLTQVILSREERLVQQQLCHHTANRPEVHGRTVSRATEEKLWGTVPECDNLGGHGLHGMAILPCETKVSELDLPFVIVENVRELDVPAGRRVRG
jgi:hypothetical protein